MVLHCYGAPAIVPQALVLPAKVPHCCSAIFSYGSPSNDVPAAIVPSNSAPEIVPMATVPHCYSAPQLLCPRMQLRPCITIQG